MELASLPYTGQRVPPRRLVLIRPSPRISVGRSERAEAESGERTYGA